MDSDNQKDSPSTSFKTLAYEEVSPIYFENKCGIYQCLSRIAHSMSCSACLKNGDLVNMGPWCSRTMCPSKRLEYRKIPVVYRMDGFAFTFVARVVQSVSRHNQGKRSILTAVLVSLVSVIIQISYPFYLPANKQSLPIQVQTLQTVLLSFQVQSSTVQVAYAIEEPDVRKANTVQSHRVTVSSFPRLPYDA